MNKIKNPCSNKLGTAGRKWLQLFMRRYPDISKRKSQNLNPARAQKRHEKGNRLCLHKVPVALARKGSKPVHNIASEHGQNVTVLSCGNALRQVIPPVILFKGKGGDLSGVKTYRLAVKYL
ncbi:hypothetical protein QE152_g38342 [Popillia japonica]|uniref:Ribosomal protein S12 n=1 Tax=Popillia japonica TaxID=7064 RepID=A0AAW1HX72_POPJA